MHKRSSSKAGTAARPAPWAGAVSSRGRFLGGLAVAGVSPLGAGCGQDADEGAGRPASGANTDLEILSFVLRLERVEAAFYAEVIGRGLLDGRALELAAAFAEHEREHVAALEALIRDLGGRPGRPFPTDFAIQERSEALALARELEDLGADAYLAQLRRLGRDDVVAKVTSIYTVEARHAGALNELDDRLYTPAGPFAKPLGMPEVLRRLDRYLP